PELVEVDKVEITTGKGSEHENTVKVAQIARHPQFTTVGHGYDIALLKLETPLIFDEHISPICLPNPSQFIPTDGNAVAIGYGTSNEMDRHSSRRRHPSRDHNSNY
ncbi:hypothetical protein PMAYCL1PPCAC_27753, partial [Pristionchus mayeri]